MQIGKNVPNLNFIMREHPAGPYTESAQGLGRPTQKPSSLTQPTYLS